MPNEWKRPEDVEGGMAGHFQGVLLCRGMDLPESKSTLLRFIAQQLAGPAAEQPRFIGCVEQVNEPLYPLNRTRGCSTFFAVADADVPLLVQNLAKQQKSPVSFARSAGVERWSAALAGQFPPEFAAAYPPFDAPR